MHENFDREHEKDGVFVRDCGLQDPDLLRPDARLLRFRFVPDQNWRLFNRTWHRQIGRHEFFNNDG